MWVVYLYVMGLNLSNRQVALELGLDASDTQAMTERLRAGLVAKAPAVEPQGEMEVDEVYVVVGHKGQPDEVAKRGGSGGAAGWQARRAAARWRKTSRPSLAWYLGFFQFVHNARRRGKALLSALIAGLVA